MLIISDASVKNNLVTLISHICRGQEIIAKSIYHAMNITSSKAKLFAIRCGINHATQLQDVLQIVVIFSQMPFLLLGEFLILLSIHINFTLSSYPRILELSSIKTQIIQSYFGIV